jgi:hypothetical protein
VYENYVADMKRLMAQFSLKTEEEVVLGRAVVWHPLLNGDRFSLHTEKTGLRIRIQVSKLRFNSRAKKSSNKTDLKI